MNLEFEIALKVALKLFWNKTKSYKRWVHEKKKSIHKLPGKFVAWKLEIMVWNVFRMYYFLKYIKWEI